MLRTAVQHNDIELRLESLKRSLPLLFYYNMQNYARCGSLYTELLLSLEANFPCLGFSIQA